MRVHLVTDDGTVVFIGAVDPDDPEQFITWDSKLGVASHLRVNVTSIGARGGRMPLEPLPTSLDLWDVAPRGDVLVEPTLTRTQDLTGVPPIPLPPLDDQARKSSGETPS